MSKTLLFETGSVLRELKSLRGSADRLCHELSDYVPFTLVSSHPKGSSKQNYYLRRKGVPGRKYLGKDSEHIVNNVKTVKYCKQLMEVLDKDIALLEDLERGFVIPEYDKINEMLPHVYRNGVMPVAGLSSKKAAEWKIKMEEEKARYPVYRPEDLVYTAKDGTKMRSLSEVIIANYLLSLGITFVYELPLLIKGKKILPDFTVLSPVDNETVIIIEHQGAMSSETYQAKFIRSVLSYLETELVPNKDVFFTFNHLNRDPDLRQIDYILHSAFGYGS